MKAVKLLLPAIAFIAFTTSVCAQKYKSAKDTLKLNKEYVEVSNDVAEITAKLTVAQNNLPGYREKAGEAVSDAKKSADESLLQASKVTNGDLGDAKSAKKKAGQALDRAEDVRDANNKIKDQDKKIDKLSKQLQKKQDRLQELDVMRVAIRSMPQ